MANNNQSMQVIETVAQLQKVIDSHIAAGRTVGFTPTMGALHDGHMTLIRHSVHENDVTVCSIFVNPTQFNEATDLDKYPRTPEADASMLKKNGADILFMPSVAEVYPNGKKATVTVDLEGLDEQMEGAFRPGHFAGVVQVVHRLVEIVTPDRLYMGQKDFQQFSIIAKMLHNLQMETSLRVVPIVRAPSGLALSSRNVRLSPEHRAAAPQIHEVLKAVNSRKYRYSVADLQDYGMAQLALIKDFRPEYFMIADGHTLRPIADVRDTDYVVACVAVWAGDVRLIDNMIYKKPRSLQIFVPPLL